MQIRVDRKNECKFAERRMIKKREKIGVGEESRRREGGGGGGGGHQ